MRLSGYAFEKLKEFEGLRLEAYKCAGGVWTIGYGHTLGVHRGDKIDKDTAEVYLRQDVERFERWLAKEPYAEELSQGQWDALVSFLFNLGIVNYKQSTLRKKIIKDFNDASIPDEFRRWVYAKGKKLPGLVKRREWEAQMYCYE